jgi:serine phosphatase RsbU (regulator of sigma subunit)
MPRLYAGSRQPCAADLCMDTQSVTADQPNAEVMALFDRHRGLMSLAVLEHGRPIGLINRNIFLSQMSKPFHREVYDRKSCIAFMDKEPMVVEADATLEALTFHAVAFGEKALTDGFIVTRDRHFLGMGHGLALMRMVAEVQAEKNRQIMQSIDYASVIQRALLRTSREALASTRSEAGLVWEPRDTVGGDFYHFAPHEGGWFAGLADCTGHGVPGAFMTLIANSLLDRGLERHGPHDPARLLGEMNQGIKQMLGQGDGRGDSASSDDGLDAAFLAFDAATRQLTFAGARMALYLLHPGDEAVQTVAGDRMGVGYVQSTLGFIWKNHTVALQAGSLLLVTTDGLVDQVGGPKGIAFGKRRIHGTLLAERSRPVDDICASLQAALAAWQGDLARRDDMAFFCFRA